MKAATISATGLTIGIATVNTGVREQAIVLGEGGTKYNVPLGVGELRPLINEFGRLLEAHDTRDGLVKALSSTAWLLLRVRTTEPGVRGEGWVKPIDGQVELLARGDITSQGGDILLKMRGDATVAIKIAGTQGVMTFTGQTLLNNLAAVDEPRTDEANANGSGDAAESPSVH